MQTNQIDALLIDIPSFAGTYACNRIPIVHFRPAFFVVNTSRLTDKDLDQSHEKVVNGKHWVVVMLKERGDGEYFDSLGNPPTQNEIMEFMTRYCPNGFKHSNRMIQNPLSQACGIYCVDFVRQRSSGKKLKAYLSEFKSDLPSNDRLVVNRVTCLSSALPQHFKLNLKTLIT